MGKALVIKDIDFSQEGLGRVTFINEDSGNTGGGETVVYSINGASSITGASTYVLQPSPSGTVTWTISNSSIATLSSTTGTSVVVTPVANKGQNSIVLTATVGTKTITKNITINAPTVEDGEEEQEYEIIGDSTVTGPIRFYIDPDPYFTDSSTASTLTWSISDTTVATLTPEPYQAGIAPAAVVAPIANTGTNNIVLTATFGTTTITKNLTIIGESSSDDVVVITKTSDVVANETLKYYFSSNSTPYKRRAFIYLDIDNCSEWEMTIQPKADSPYKYGVQYHASRYISNTNPETVTLGNGSYVAYDSGWILPGSSVTCDETNNKSNTVGGANYTGKPAVIAITATHTSDESVIIDKASYLANIDFTLTKRISTSGTPGDDDLVG